MRHIALYCLCILLATTGLPQTRTVPFDQGWRFHFGSASDPHKDFNYGIVSIFSKAGKARGTAIDPAFDDRSWDSIQLPHDWAVALPFVQSDNFDVASHGFKPVGGLFSETSIGWYRKKFRVNPADSGHSFVLQFDGIFRDAQIWINGMYLGRNMSGYLGVSYDISDYLDFHRDNVVVVRVDATQYEGWFYEGAGIYRHAWLHTYAPVHIAQDGLFIYNDSLKNVHVDVTVAGNKDTCTIETYLTERNGTQITPPAYQNLQAGGTAAFRFPINNPTLWSPDHPYLYRAVTLVRVNGQIVDSLTQRFGIKTIKIDPEQGLFLNGRHLEIKGVCCHPDHAGLGMALPDAIQYYRVKRLKELGVNAYRTSHYAQSPELMDACDSLGLLVLDEQRQLNSSPEYIDQFERLVRRDRSRACVFLWSIGNEEGFIQTRPEGRRIAQTFIALQRELDPTRTCTYAADVPNVFKGVNEVIPVRGFNYRQFAIADYHRDHPGQPILGTEMGSTVSTRGEFQKDTVKGYLPDEDSTAPWWASRAETWWTLAVPQPWWMGGFVWTGFDYRGEPTPFFWPVIHSHFGIMDDCGFPKNIYYYYQSWWTDKDVLHISPHWNWKGKEGQPIDVWVNSNADKVEIKLNGKSLGEKDMPRNGHLQWNVPYAPGRLEAIAIRQGRRLTAKVETTGAPTRLVLDPDTTIMTADGRDAIVLNVHTVDAQGREVPDAQNHLIFTVNGPGRFIGVGNGDPSSHEPEQCKPNDWQRSLFNGKCQIILQSIPDAGEITVTAASDGLASATIMIQSKPVQ
jgi:beta-galactosidase